MAMALPRPSRSTTQSRTCSTEKSRLELAAFAQAAFAKATASQGDRRSGISEKWKSYKITKLNRDS